MYTFQVLIYIEYHLKGNSHCSNNCVRPASLISSNMNKDLYQSTPQTENLIEIGENQRTRGSTAKTGFDQLLTYPNFLAYQKESKASLHALLLLLVNALTLLGWCEAWDQYTRTLKIWEGTTTLSSYPMFFLCTDAFSDAIFY